MRPKAARTPATERDLLTVPPHLVGEIIDGELLTSPRPTARHALASTRLGAELDAEFGRRGGGGHGGWIILDEPELHLVGQVIGYLWLIDPGPRLLEVFELERDRWQRAASFSGDERIRAAPFDAVELDLGLLWDVPR